MPTLNFPGKQFKLDCETITRIPEGYLLTGKNVLIELPLACNSFYQHGWQSWSLTAWTGLRPQPALKPAIMRPGLTDPVYALHPFPNGSWLGATSLEDGSILLLGALGLDSHVQMRQGALQGWFETASGVAESQRWYVGCGTESELFGNYARLLGEIFGQLPARSTQRVWCSWYSLYTAIDEHSLTNIFDDLHGLPFDVLQIDDGWQVAIGDWQANPKFPTGMASLAEKIKATGRKAGLWLAPLLLVPSSRTYRDHPDWILRDDRGRPVPAGFNWGEPLFALDTTHPGVLAWLEALMKTVRGWGYSYIKLDFLYAGALPGKRHIDMPREAAYRHGLNVLRLAMGSDVYFLACGAPILPSLGLCDAMRIGTDVAAEWESYRDEVLLTNPTTPSAKNAIRTCVNRLWLASLVHVDPDVVYFRSAHNQLTTAQKAMLQDLALICDFRATSDLPQSLAGAEHQALERFLTIPRPNILRSGRYTFEFDGRSVDFSTAMSLPLPPTGAALLVSALIGWLASQPFVLKIYDQLNLAALKRIKDRNLT